MKTNELLLGHGGLTGDVLTVYEKLRVRDDMIKSLDGLDPLAISKLEAFEYLNSLTHRPKGAKGGYRHGGGFTTLYTTTLEEIEELRNINNDAIAKHKEREKREEIEYLTKVIARGENQRRLMTNAEYKVWRKDYNNIMNEGGERYIPNLVTVEQLERARKELAELKG